VWTVHLLPAERSGHRVIDGERVCQAIEAIGPPEAVQAQAVRKVYYNLVITALSIGAAFIIGTIELLGILTSELHLHGALVVLSRPRA